MRSAVVLLLAALLMAACSNGDAAGTSPASTSKPGGESIVIQTLMVIADTSGSEPIATGEVLEGSTLAGSSFCAGGTILDTHASLDPAVEPLGLIDRRITCSDGTVRIVFTPDPATQTGTWTIVTGTGAFEGLRGSGVMETKYGPDNDSPSLETYTGTVTR